MGLHLSLNRRPNIPPMANWNHDHEHDWSDSDSEPERLHYDSETDEYVECRPIYAVKGSDDELEVFSSKWYKKRPLVTYSSDFGSNGRILGGENVPEEILSLILSHVDTTSLLNCRLVCQRWRNIVDSDIWRFKLGKKVYRKLQNVLIDITSPFPVFYKVYKNKPFDRNLIKNPSGEENFRYWDIVKNGGDGWKVEDPPAGADALPLDDDFSKTSCFATSFIPSSKVQLIDLWAEGVAPIIMDELRPTIYISEWYAARFDCACTYTVCVVLLNKKQKKLQAFKETKRVEQWQGREWHKVEHEFKDFCEGVRYIKFFHSGCDCQFWKGHYGSKMTRACVKIIL